MHIAFVTPEFLKGDLLYPGGLSTYTFNTGLALKERGHQVTIYLSGEKDREIVFHGLRVIERRLRIPLLCKPIHYILSRWLSDGMHRVWSSLTINRYLQKNLTKERIDLVHYTNWKAIGLFRITHPSLLRISSYDALWDNNPGNQHIGKRFIQWLEKVSIKRFKVIIGPGDYLARFIEKDLRLPRPIELIPTPVHLKLNKDEEKKELKQRSKSHIKKVLYAGTVSGIKGAELLFEIITRYLERFDDVSFVIAGKSGIVNGVSCRPALEKLSKKYPHRFRYHTHLERALLESEYASSDLVLIPSLIDNFPNTALEAMSNGAIILASDAASLGTLLHDGVNGFLMDHRNPDGWIDRIRFILFELPQEERNKIQNQMERSLVTHGMDHAIDRLLAVYKTVIGA